MRIDVELAAKFELHRLKYSCLLLLLLSEFGTDRSGISGHGDEEEIRNFLKFRTWAAIGNNLLLKMDSQNKINIGTSSVSLVT